MKNTKSYRTNQPQIYIAATLTYIALTLGAIIYGNYVGHGQQMVVLANIAMGAGFLVYLKIYEYPVNFSMQIYDKKCLYIAWSLIFIMIIANYNPIDKAFSENIEPNIWLLIEAISAAFASEIVFRVLGTFSFTQIKVKEEAIMAVAYAFFYLYRIIYGVESGVIAFCIALGVGTMMTGIYLRYRKLGANMLMQFLLYYLVNVTVINSSTESSDFRKFSLILMLISTIGMLLYGCVLLKRYNEEGVFNDQKKIREQEKKQSQFKKAFLDSKEKYEEKVNEKAAPKVEARREKYLEKKKKKNEKRKEKEMKKEGRAKGK